VRDHRQRNRELVLERERRYRESLSPALRQHRARDYNLKMQYGKGFGIEQYEAMLVAQLGGCAICGRSPESGKPLHVDHDHKTGRVRALLCYACNMGMIAVDACPDWPARAAGYQARHATEGN